MWHSVVKFWHRYKPRVAFYLDLGFLSLRTHIMCIAYERRAYEYLRISWHFFKWRGDFDLYVPDEQRCAR